MTVDATEPERTVDQNELRTHQALSLTLLVSAYLLDDWRLVAVQSAVFLLTTLTPRLGPYVLLYRLVLRPLGAIKPDVRVDNPEAHRFATTVGTVVSGLGAYCLFTGAATVGWALVWLILVLGTLAIFGWCAGCFTYYMIHRLGMGGFFRYAPVTGTFPGARPPKKYRG